MISLITTHMLELSGALLVFALVLSIMNGERR